VLKVSGDGVTVSGGRIDGVTAGGTDRREHGLADPDQVTAATGSYRAESDVLGRFLADRCMVGHGTVGSSELFTA
jgi:phage/plasmid-associated DNA primase